jgi:hypothetical protein
MVVFDLSKVAVQLNAVNAHANERFSEVQTLIQNGYVSEFTPDEKNAADNAFNRLEEVFSQLAKTHEHLKRLKDAYEDAFEKETD